MIAVPAGIGGGVLFVPIVSGFFPFHLDFVRGQVAGGVGERARRGTGPAALRACGPSPRAAADAARVGRRHRRGTGGACLAVAIVETALGVTILCIAALMWRAKKSAYPGVARPDALGAALRMSGIYHDHAFARDIGWQAQRTPLGLLLFTGIGVLAGVFGLGAGWPTCRC